MVAKARQINFFPWFALWSSLAAVAATLQKIDLARFVQFIFRSMKIKKGDNILVISGKDKGKTGKIFRALPKQSAILVEGINLKKKHVKPKRQGEKGQLISTPAILNVSNVKLICPKCGKAVRVGYEVEGENKSRICKKCKQKI
jgi:large subunit ribosomal protein L24